MHSPKADGREHQRDNSRYAQQQPAPGHEPQIPGLHQQVDRYPSEQEPDNRRIGSSMRMCDHLLVGDRDRDQGPDHHEQPVHRQPCRQDGVLRLVRMTANDMIVAAALTGHGLAWVPDDAVGEHIAPGRLVSVLDDWSQTFPGYHLYYASRSSSPALALVVEALRQAHG